MFSEQRLTQKLLKAGQSAEKMCNWSAQQQMDCISHPFLRLRDHCKSSSTKDPKVAVLKILRARVRMDRVILSSAHVRTDTLMNSAVMVA